MANQIAPLTNGRPLSTLADAPETAPRPTTWLPQLPNFVRSIFMTGDRDTVTAATNPLPPSTLPSPAAAMGVATRHVTSPKSAGLAPLKRRDNGPRVRDLQQLLRDVGLLRIEPNGSFDPLTERAVIDFQATFSGADGAQLDDDGVAGDNTIVALRQRKAWLANHPNGRDEVMTATEDYGHLGEVQALRPNVTGNEVTRAQRLLRTLGYRLQVTGHYDRMTSDAVEDFQRRFNQISGGKLEVDGCIGAFTGEAMYHAADATAESPVSWLSYAQNAAAATPAGSGRPVGTAPVPLPTPQQPPATNSHGPQPLLQPGSKDRASVMVLQQELRNLGYDIAADGDYGGTTAAAVTDFQRLYSLFTSRVVVADGVAGDDTRRAIDDATATNLMSRLPAFMRTAKVEVGYNRGTVLPVVTRRSDDGGRLETRVALAYYAMQNAAKDDQPLTTSETFRTMQDQRGLYASYLAARHRGQAHAAVARPGWSNHQTGIAVDIYTMNEHEGALGWLNANGRKYGFMRTVPSEPWHWEYRVDRLPNAARRFYGLPALTSDALPTAPASSTSRVRRARAYRHERIGGSLREPTTAASGSDTPAHDPLPPCTAARLRTTMRVTRSRVAVTAFSHDQKSEPLTQTFTDSF